MKNFDAMQALLRCPCCQSSALSVTDDARDMVCEPCGSRYPVSFGRPVLLRPDNDLFSQVDYCEAKAPVLKATGRSLKSLVPNASVNLSSQRVLARVRRLLEEMPSATVLVVGGGRQRQWLDERLGADGSVQVIYSDIDTGADIDLFCDAHDLPFMDGAFDAVVTTAVLEHVLYPERVAAEITRVLRQGGLLYSELPFMQQVHEGAYDFTRYTLSGHRRLFNHFAELESGMVAGPGTALVWAIEHFAMAFVVRSALRNILKAVVRLLFGWIKYFDLLLANKPAAMDAASCTYILGVKVEDRTADSEIIDRYVGGQNLRHVST